MLNETILEQFTNCYDENGWFVALKSAASGLTADQAAWKTEGVDNSIWQILSHLNYYNHAYLERFKGNAYEYTKATNKETFELPEGPTEEAWRAEVENFDSIMMEWRELIKKARDSKFDELAPPRNNLHGD